MAAAFKDKKPAGGPVFAPAAAPQPPRPGAAPGAAQQPLTGLKGRLAALEEKLPGALKSRAAACAFLAVAVLAGVFGIGGGKLCAYRSSTEMLYLMADSRYGVSIVEELDAALSAAASITDLCAARLGEQDPAVAAAREAIALRKEKPGGTGPAYDYEANLALQSAVGHLYNLVRYELDDSAGAALQGQWSTFASCQDRIARSGYNDAVAAYNQAAGAFPANLIGALWGAGELERFG